jgi:diaminopimelate epimerase
MRRRFKKMNGAGNDFVVVDNRDGSVSLSADRVARACDRRRGIGADGLILIEPEPKHDFFMRYYNADGSEEKMCGNGARCSAAFAAAADVGEVDASGRRRVRFLTGAGPVVATVVWDSPTRASIETDLMDATGMKLDLSVQVAQERLNVHFMIVGTRHALVPVDDAGSIKSIYVNELGRAVRNHALFAPEGANVNFVSLDSDGRVHIRTYEKGVEAETYACGTGSVAAAVCYAHRALCQSPVTVVQRQGDELRIRFTLVDDGAREVSLAGPADVNFEGTFDF